jgi:hypothetical protein
MKRPVLLATLLFLAIATAAPAEGSSAAAGPLKTTATWSQSAAGPKAYWGAAAFAPTVGRLVAFGGLSENRLLTGTFLFDPVGGTWVTVPAARTGPEARAHDTLAWDPGRKRVVLFGGLGSRSAALQDTWAFDPQAKTWTSLVSSCKRFSCPPTRWGHGMVWSSVLGKLLVFGGTKSGADAFLDDLWAFGSSWTELKPSGARPVGRFLFGMAEDARTGLIVVYGGATVGLSGLNDTWLLDPRTTTWTRVATATTPPVWGEIAMGWSPSVGAVVLTGGSDRDGLMVASPGTWAFDMSTRTWVRLATTGGVPSARKEATLTANPIDGSAILFGGEDGSIPPGFSDWTWILR